MPLNEYQRRRASRDGRRSECKACSAKAAKKRNPFTRCTINGRATELVKGGRKRAKRKGLKWSITRSWVRERIADGHCQITGLPFELTATGRYYRNPRAPSIHRLDNSKGYEPGNCAMVICQLNAALNEWPEALFAEMAAAYLTSNVQQIAA